MNISIDLHVDCHVTLAGSDKFSLLSRNGRSTASKTSNQVYNYSARGCSYLRRHLRLFASFGGISVMNSQIPLLANPTNGSVSICNSSELLRFPASRNFYAFGDSYSAGIGANCGWVKDEFDAKGSCLKCEGAFPYQVIEVADASECMEVYHVGCTGASMADILKTGWNNRTSQLELMNSTTGEGGWGTLSIGGNDVGFAHIVANCIMFDRPTCDADLEYTEDLIRDPLLLSKFTETYLKVLGAANDPDFRLIVPGYAQFFNAETEICDNKYIFYGRYLTQEFRARLNTMISDLNLVIQIAVAIVQMQLVFSNSGKAIYYEDWDSLFWGHRFCEEAPKGWTDAWFFTINGPDTLPNDTVVSARIDPPDGEKLVDIMSLASKCGGQPRADLTAQMLCDWALKLEEGIMPSGNVSTFGYPWWITKTLHPKSIAHWQLGKMIYKKWMNGEYS